VHVRKKGREEYCVIREANDIDRTGDNDRVYSKQPEASGFVEIRQQATEMFKDRGVGDLRTVPTRENPGRPEGDGPVNSAR